MSSAATKTTHPAPMARSRRSDVNTPVVTRPRLSAMPVAAASMAAVPNNIHAITAQATTSRMAQVVNPIH